MSGAAPPSAAALRLALVRPHAVRLAAAFLLLLVSIAIQLSYPRFIAALVDYAVNRDEQPRPDGRILGIAAILLVQAGAFGVQNYLFSTTGTRIVAQLRKSLFSTILGQEIGYFDSQPVGELTGRLASDVEQLQDSLTTNLAVLIQAVLTCAGSCAMLFDLSPSLSLATVLVIPPVALASRWIARRVRDKARLRQQELARCGHIAQEVISNVRLVHAFGRQAEEVTRYGEATDAARDFSLACSRLFSGFNALGVLVQSMALLLAVWIGGGLVARHSMSIGDLTGFILYSGMAVASAVSVSGLWAQWMRSVGATDRIFELLRRPPARTGGRKSGRLRGEVAFDRVRFCYPSRPDRAALEDFSLAIEAGEHVALVGPSGAGKSTVVNLLLGFYPPGEGRVLFDGLDAAGLDRVSLRRHIAVVEQEPSLFSGSIIDNLLYACPEGAAGRDEVLAAAVAANLDDFVRTLPQGYDTPVGNRGIQLSGGQKQRIAIARALLRDPAILVFDEATSALDSENEDKIRSALDRLMEGRTSVTIAHRLSTVAGADRIVVLEKGRIIQAGPHARLCGEQDGLYARLIRGQADRLRAV